MEPGSALHNNGRLATNTLSSSERSSNEVPRKVTHLCSAFRNVAGQHWAIAAVEYVPDRENLCPADVGIEIVERRRLIS